MVFRVKSRECAKVQQIRPSKLQKFVNKHLLVELGLNGAICQRTAARWLNKLGFQACHVQKGVYIDGHERGEVVAARKNYIEFMEREVFL